MREEAADAGRNESKLWHDKDYPQIQLSRFPCGFQMPDSGRFGNAKFFKKHLASPGRTLIIVAV